MPLTAIGFDGDDTLWESETQFHLTQARYRELLADDVDAQVLDARLLDVERANLHLYGYGAKSFTLSLIETAIELAGDRLDISDVAEILAAGKDLLAHPVELRPGARAAVEAARELGLTVLLVTKGDLFHQESKVAASGVAEVFESVEIVAEKDPATYARVLVRMGSRPARFCMIGNSVRSDIAPVLELGGAGVHVPYHHTWELEHAEVDEAHPRLARVREIRQAPAAIAALSQDAPG